MLAMRSVCFIHPLLFLAIAESISNTPFLPPHAQFNNQLMSHIWVSLAAVSCLLIVRISSYLCYTIRLF